VAAGRPAPADLPSPLMARTLAILLSVLKLHLPAAWKTVQLAVVMLWNAAARSGGEHARAGTPCAPPLPRAAVARAPGSSAGSSHHEASHKHHLALSGVYAVRAVRLLVLQLPWRGTL